MIKRITRSRLTKKSQVTIPLMVREKLGVKPGDQVEFLIDKSNVVYIARPRSRADEFFGAGKKHAQGKDLSEEGLKKAIEKAYDEEAKHVAREGIYED
ncbi:MAG: type II toxin-antitoxin system PrlF family antitoxin [Candidatus Yanofskybacteria bacterium]|nr:type II toxin-antitoxin system PrlF family antitoxin [Candidatus Yanofskybacteria bacterium]